MVDLIDIPCFDEDGNLNVIVEAPRGSEVKLTYERRLGSFVFQRRLPPGLAYPYDWGFVPTTHAEDGDPLDAMVLLEAATWPGVIIPSRPIGIVRVRQRDGPRAKPVRNDRILALPAGDDRYASATDLPVQLRRDLDQFFVTVGRQLHHEVVIEGWSGPRAALAAIRRAARARDHRAENGE